MEFSDYIVYVDESGDHGLESIDDNYPVFVLVFCIFKKEKYSENIVKDIINLKFKYLGHDQVILHEREIRKSLHPFEFLRNAEQSVNGILNWYSFGSQKWYRFSCHFVLHPIAVTCHNYGFGMVK